MIQASQEFRDCVRNGYKFVNYADITLRDGTVLNLIPGDFVVGGFSMVDEMSEGKFGVGFAIGKTINVTLANHTNKFSMYDFYKSIIYIYVAVELPDGKILKEKKGKYYTINPTSPGDTIKLSGVDSMYLLDKAYDSELSYPATLQEIISDCCLRCGINIGFKQFDRYNYTVNQKPEDATYREVVSYVAQIAGYNARISNDDALELIWYDETFMDIDRLDGSNFLSYEESDSYDGGDFADYTQAVLFDGGGFADLLPINVNKVKSLSVGTDDIVITGIKVETDNAKILKGTEDYLIKISDNPLCIGYEEEIAEYLYGKLAGYHFRALSCETTNNPLFEPYDSCYVYDKKGNGYFTLINSVEYKINGFTRIACKADDPIKNKSSYTSEAAKAIVKARRNTEEQLSTYDLAVQNMNMLAANAMGLYRETESQSDGSHIYYQSNRPITKNTDGKCVFEKGAVVYKMMGDGFFVSTDGGTSFATGFDSNGNAVLNVLSAIGISFDWAKGGTLDLGGENNINGEMIVYNSSGTVVGKFNKDGLWASNGYFEGRIVSKDAIITGGVVNIETSSDEDSSIVLKGGSKSIYIRPIGINFNESFSSGTTITKDRIKVGDTSYVELTSAKIYLYGGTQSVTIEPGSYQQTSGEVYMNLSNYTMNTSTIKINGGSGYTNSIETTNGIKIGGTAIFNSGITVSGIDGCKINCDSIFDGDVQFKQPVSLSSAATLTCDADVKFSKNLTVGSSYSGTLTTNYDLYVKGDAKLGSSTSSYVGFFGSTGSTKKTVSTIYSTSNATASTCATKINEIINALKGYNLL